jgi:DNA-binding NarL/FixJ family response regulator
MKAISPSIQIVVSGGHDDDAYRAAAFSAGASAYLPAEAASTRLIPALGELLVNVHDSRSWQKR